MPTRFPELSGSEKKVDMKKADDGRTNCKDERQVVV